MVLASASPPCETESTVSKTGTLAAAARQADRVVISLGRFAHNGSYLLRKNSSLEDSRICVDTEKWIDGHHDPIDDWWHGDAPDGKKEATQRRIQAHPNFRKCIREIQVKVLMEPITVVKCDWGMHRSVGCLELALRDLDKMNSTQDLCIYLLHIDLDGAIEEDWQYLTKLVI